MYEAVTISYIIHYNNSMSTSVVTVTITSINYHTLTKQMNANPFTYKTEET